MQANAFIGRSEPLSALESALLETISGMPQIVVLDGVAGSGRQTLLQRFHEGRESRPLLLSISLLEGEDGLRSLVRLYAAFYQALHSDEALKEKVVDLLSTAVKSATGIRGNWLNAILEGIAKQPPEEGATSFQVTLPRESPLAALVEYLLHVMSISPVLLSVSGSFHMGSYPLWAFISTLLGEAARQKLPLMLVFAPETAHNFPEEKEASPLYQPLAGLLEALPEGVGVRKSSLKAFSAEEGREMLSALYPVHRLSDSFADELLRLSEGLPGLAVAYLEVMESTGILVQADDEAWVCTTELKSVDWERTLAPIPEEHLALGRQMLRAAALEGRAFTTSVLAEHLGEEKDTIDDLLDELEDLVREVVFHEGVQSWIYEFKSELVHRHFVLGLESVAKKELARSLAELLGKSYVPKAPEYAIKAARLWSEAGETKRATALINFVISNERVETLQMGAELLLTHSELKYPKTLYRNLLLMMLERVGSVAPPEAMLAAVDKFEAWATAEQDTDLLPRIALYRAKFLLRSGKPKEATAFAQQAQKAFARHGQADREAEALVTQALIAQGTGDIAMANDLASRALKKSEFPPVKAQALYIRGLNHKGRGELQPALEHLKEALELSGRSGLVALNQDIAVHVGEVLLLGGKSQDAVQLLTQLLEMAERTKSAPRLLRAHSLLAKAKAALQDPQGATEHASKALQLARDLKVRPAEAESLLDLGIFNLMQRKFDEAQVFLRECEKLARELKAKPLLKEILFHQGMVHTAANDHNRAVQAYQECLKLTGELKDERREAMAHFNLGSLYLHKGELSRARTHLEQAAQLLEKVGTPDQKTAVKKALDQLEVKIN